MLTALAGIVATCTSCAGIEPSIEAYEGQVPAELVLVLPEGRRELASVEDFVREKQRLGFSVSWIEFDRRLEPSERLQVVSAGLPKPEGVPRFAMILASPEELPMGPWSVDGLDGHVESDLPLFLGLTDTTSPLDDEHWQAASDPDFPWFIGRVPFGDEACLATTLEASRTYPERATKLALFGSERFAVWGDAAWIMSRARARFRGDWQVLTFGEDPPSDLRLGGGLEVARLEHEVLAAVPADALEGAASPESLEFALCWASLAPSLVYLNSHGTGGFGGVIGEYLLSDWRLERFGLQAEARGLQAKPSVPAILVSIACQAGPPDSDLTRRLFEEGWVAAMVASTATTAPVPLLPAVRAEIEAGAVLDSSLPLGMAMHLFRARYLEDADDSFSFLLSGSVRAEVAKNLLGLTVYGDPTLRLPGARRGTSAE